MYFCYIDESGGFEAVTQKRSATPLMVIAGLIIPADAIAPITAEFLALKKWFHPKARGTRLGLQLYEIKGSDLRSHIRGKSRSERARAITLLDRTVKIVTSHDCRLVGQIWVKEQGSGLDPVRTYTASIQGIARHFEHFLATQGTQGIMLCDSRDHHQNIEVAHSVFTRKHKSNGDEVPSVLEVPVFGSSENHTGLQIADLLASGLLFPMASRSYCSDMPLGPHTHPRFDILRARYARPLKQLRYIHMSNQGKVLGGITVSDARGHQPSSRLFEVPGDS